jgi:hypothetical protein
LALVGFVSDFTIIISYSPAGRGPNELERSSIWIADALKLMSAMFESS